MTNVVSPMRWNTILPNCYKKEVENMIIDAHAHAYPDRLAERAMGVLKQASLTESVTDGTTRSLLEHMDRCKVDRTVVANIATNAHQQPAVNDWAAQVKSDRLLCFGSVYPHAEDRIEELHRIKELGLYGVKLHPAYQHFYVDDPEVFPIYETCEELGLPILFHGGYDPYDPLRNYALPATFLPVIETFPKLKVIVGHFGGFINWELADQFLVGKEIYFDTSLAVAYLDDERMCDMIHRHGAHKVLFGSDCPWMSAQVGIEKIARMDLTEEERELILHKNAERILGL